RSSTPPTSRSCARRRPPTAPGPSSTRCSRATTSRTVRSSSRSPLCTSRTRPRPPSTWRRWPRGSRAPSPRRLRRTPAELAQLLAERDQQAAVAAETARIEAEATSLGYQVGSKPYKYLIQTALDETGGDLKAAHDALLSERQAWIDQYVGQKAREQAGSPISPPAGAGTMPSQEREMPKSWADTKR